MVLKTVGGVLLTICTALASFGLNTAITNSDRIMAIESRRFSARDGQAIWQEIARIREDLAQIPKEVPPPWFREMVRQQGARITVLEGAISAIREGQAKILANLTESRSLDIELREAIREMAERLVKLEAWRDGPQKGG